MAAPRVFPTPPVLHMDDERAFRPLVVTKQLALSTWTLVFEIWFSGSFLPTAVIRPLDNKTFHKLEDNKSVP